MAPVCLSRFRPRSLSVRRCCCSACWSSSSGGRFRSCSGIDWCVWLLRWLGSESDIGASWCGELRSAQHLGATAQLSKYMLSRSHAGCCCWTWGSGARKGSLQQGSASDTRGHEGVGRYVQVLAWKVVLERMWDRDDRRRRPQRHTPPMRRTGFSGPRSTKRVS